MAMLAGEGGGGAKSTAAKKVVFFNLFYPSFQDSSISKTEAKFLVPDWAIYGATNCLVHAEPEMVISLQTVYEQSKQ